MASKSEGIADDKQSSPDLDVVPDASSKLAERKREIKGGLPYSSSPGTFKKALEGVIVAERPERFSGDFLATVLKVSGDRRGRSLLFLRK